jgi:hypothetical protein
MTPDEKPNAGIDDRRVEETTLPDGKWISTVLLPIEHPGGMWFETMVFATQGAGSDDLDCVRYRTEEEARAGHADVVAEWMAKVAH